MATLKNSAQLDVQTIEDFVNEQGTTVEELVLLHDDIMTTNEDGMIVIVSVEKLHSGLVWVVTDLLDTGWMVEHRFLPDGTVTHHKTR